MIKARLCLPNSEKPEKQIAVTHTVHKREVQKRPPSAASVKVDFFPSAGRKSFTSSQSLMELLGQVG